METMVYVACDPAFPGTAYAICVDRPEFSKETTKSLESWIKEGAEIKRLTKADGLAMLDKWLRINRPKQQELLPPN